MEDKNRFSILLEHLLEVAEVKNYTLAKRLQYDVSYISKWVSGRMLPAKKTEKRVMEGISACVVDEATDDGRNLLLREYSVSIPSDLKAAIYDNLIAEYDYLKEELDSGEARIGPYTDFWAELNMLQYLTKMAHPVLRRVSQLDIVAVMDLMEMAREYRLKVANLQNGQLVDQRCYDNVYFKLMIDISREKWDPIYDAALIINVLTNFSHIHFKLFGSTAGWLAFSKFLCCVLEAFGSSPLSRCYAAARAYLFFPFSFSPGPIPMKQKSRCMRLFRLHTAGFDFNSLGNSFPKTYQRFTTSLYRPS